MEVSKMKLMDLQARLVLEQELFEVKRRLMKKGNDLNSKIISLLKNRNIQFINVQSDEIEHLQAEE